MKEHLGEDAFYDFETVRSSVRELEPIPDRMRPEQFQTPRHVPDFPFKVSPPHSQTKPIEEQLAYARQAFESQGYTLIEEDGCTLLLRDESGGILRVRVGEGGVHRIPAAAVASFMKSAPCIPNAEIGRRPRGDSKEG